jgi:signal transduction histidine kinase
VLGRLSLRARLVLGVIVLATVGLAVADVATYASLRSFLLDRTDASLREARPEIEHGAFDRRGCDNRPPPGATPGDFAEVRNEDGDVVCSWQETSFGAAAAFSPPRLPAEIRTDDAFTVSARDGGARYRVLAWREPSSGALFVAAKPLQDVDATLRRLLGIELLVTVAVLAALAALGLWVVRIGLRPLDEIGATAGAIAAGDLTKRVERAEPTTEVGRLGLALNAMLGQIESSFNAQAASERKLRRFVADASHELRTPLAAVRAYSELFGRGAEERPEDLARSMHGISRESERMSLLVDDLLLLARLDEGRPLEREPVELDHVVGESVETARTLEPERPIEFTAEPARVIGDRDRLRQIVDNLLANVRNHTPPGSRAHVRVGPLNGHAVIEVEDAGPGLEAADDAERVFERFYRTDSSRSRTSGGVGLGLSIVTAVARAHGGDVTATSMRGEGATFRITLPLENDNRGETT